jgi:hypothetical protein
MTADVALFPAEFAGCGLVEQAAAAMWITDFAGTVVAVNGAGRDARV